MRLQERQRLSHDLLPMHQMTRSIVSHRRRRRTIKRVGVVRRCRRATADLHQPFADVSHLPIPSDGASMIPLIPMQQLGVLLQMRPAAAGVADDRIEPVDVVQIEIPPRQVAGEFQFAIVGVERPAAELHRRRDDFAAVGQQHVGRRAVDRAVQQILHAAGERARRGTSAASWAFPAARCGRSRRERPPSASSLPSVATAWAAASSRRAVASRSADRSADRATSLARTPATTAAAGRETRACSSERAAARARRRHAAVPLRRGRFPAASRNRPPPGTPFGTPSSRGSTTSPRQTSASRRAARRPPRASAESGRAGCSAQTSSRRTSGTWASTCRSACIAAAPSSRAI